MSVWTETECERCLFGHGSKPDGNVREMAVLGDVIMYIYAKACATISRMFLLGLELMLHWRPNGVSFPAVTPVAGRSWERSELT